MLAVLLALVMAFSIGVTALAADADDVVWTPVPTSTEGLEKGDYYFDFEAMFTENHDQPMCEDDDNDTPWYQDDLDYYNAAQWFVDFDVWDVMVIWPDDESYVGETWMLQYLRSYGAEWIAVHMDGYSDDLQPGDYYFDIDAYVDAIYSVRAEKYSWTMKGSSRSASGSARKCSMRIPAKIRSGMNTAPTATSCCCM